jgi:hypothetical protein
MLAVVLVTTQTPLASPRIAPCIVSVHILTDNGLLWYLISEAHATGCVTERTQRRRQRDEVLPGRDGAAYFRGRTEGSGHERSRAAKHPRIFAGA